MGSDGKGQAHVHAAGVALDGVSMNFSTSAKATISSNLRAISALRHAQDGAVEEDVLAPGQFGMKAGAHLQQAGDAPFDLDVPAGGGGDPGQDLQQRAFAGSVAADDAQHLALLHLKADIIQCQDRFAGPFKRSPPGQSWYRGRAACAGVPTGSLRSRLRVPVPITPRSYCLVKCSTEMTVLDIILS